MFLWPGCHHYLQMSLKHPLTSWQDSSWLGLKITPGGNGTQNYPCLGGGPWGLHPLAIDVREQVLWPRKLSVTQLQGSWQLPPCPSTLLAEIDTTWVTTATAPRGSPEIDPRSSRWISVTPAASPRQSRLQASTPGPPQPQAGPSSCPSRPTDQLILASPACPGCP